MSARHKRLLSSILLGPVSGNVQWHEIEGLLHHLGAEIESGHGAKFKVRLNGTEFTLHRPHNSNVCSKRDLHLLRDFLVAANIGMPSLEHSS